LRECPGGGGAATGLHFPVRPDDHHAGMTRTRLQAAALAVLLLAAGCSDSPGGATAATTVAFTTGTTTTTTTTTTTLAPTTTTSTTTTTTIPRLDRGDGATVVRLRADLAALLANGPRKSGTPAEAAAAEYFAAVAVEITGSAAELQPVSLPNGAVSQNVWASPVGGGDRLLVLGAHLDSVDGAPGGNDNGSGSVILLEILRRLVEDPPDGLRVVVVGFGAEERIGDSGHHFGSRHAVDELVAADALPAFMISVDMVGVGNDLQVIDFRDADPAFADELWEVAVAAGFEVDRQSRGEISDHVAFARAGVPAAHIWRSEDPEYHTPGDDDFADAAVLESLALVEVLIDHLIPEPHELEGGDQDHI